jgi:hypothetical protein
MGLARDQRYVLKELLYGKTEIAFDAAQITDMGNTVSGIPVSLPPLSAFVFRIQQ